MGKLIDDNLVKFSLEDLEKELDGRKRIIKAHEVGNKIKDMLEKNFSKSEDPRKVTLKLNDDNSEILIKIEEN